MVTLRPVHRTNILNQRLLRNVSGTRFLTSSHTFPVPEPSSLHPSWLSDTKTRIGKCIMFGMKPELVDEAGKILYEISRDWRELVAGSEGFLTSKDRTGLDRQEIVWGEQDSMGHVNNVMYVRFAESGRCNWTRNFAKYHDPANKTQWEELLSSKSMGLILRSITVDFKFPMTWPDRISVYHKIRARPTESTESLILDVMILSEVKQRPAARCLDDVVPYDYRKGRKRVLAPFMLEQFIKTFDLQEAVEKENSGRVQSLLDQVRWLEKQSWDRSDAKEDLGFGNS